MFGFLSAMLSIITLGYSVPVDQLARSLQEIRDRTPFSMHEFDCIEYKPRLVDAPEPVVAVIERRTRIRVLKREHCYRVEMFGIENDMEPPTLIRTLVWDGERYMTSERDARGRDHITILREPRITLQQCVSIFCETHGRDVSIIDFAKGILMAKNL